MGPLLESNNPIMDNRTRFAAALVFAGAIVISLCQMAALADQPLRYPQRQERNAHREPSES